MDYNNETLERTVNENSNSKSCDLSKVILNLSKSQIISKYYCYVCADENPQFSESLFDGRVVKYCGSCFVIVKEAKEIIQ